MNPKLPKIVALVGAGVIGRGWIRVFAPHGVEVRVYDPNPEQIPQTLAWLAQDLAADVAEGFVTAAKRDTIIAMTRTGKAIWPRPWPTSTTCRRALRKSSSEAGAVCRTRPSGAGQGHHRVLDLRARYRRDCQGPARRAALRHGASLQSAASDAGR